MTFFLLDEESQVGDPNARRRRLTTDENQGNDDRRPSSLSTTKYRTTMLVSVDDSLARSAGEPVDRRR